VLPVHCGGVLQWHSPTPPHPTLKPSNPQTPQTQKTSGRLPFERARDSALQRAVVPPRQPLPAVQAHRQPLLSGTGVPAGAARWVVCGGGARGVWVCVLGVCFWRWSAFGASGGGLKYAVGTNRLWTKATPTTYSRTPQPINQPKTTSQRHIDTTTQAIPGLSPVPWWGTLFPLAVVLTVNGVKEAFDDYWRHVSDAQVNRR